MEKHLHIICLDVPYPVDYGGVFDLFYKLPALKEKGVKIHLHCFEYGRGQQAELNKYCESVDYYKRRTGLPGISLKLPYIVSSRRNAGLINNLLQDDYPVLMEGIHCTSLLTDARFKNRKCFVRLHNAEHIYYQYLFNTSAGYFKRLYYSWESRQLLKYQKRISESAVFWSVSESDVQEYQKIGYKKISFLPLFMPPWKVNTVKGKGTFCLYHGNLSVAENEKAALWLLENVFTQVEIPFVIAGKKPGATLQAVASKKPNTCLVANPTETEMQDMISKAHIHIIPSFNATGIKLKLFNALFNGRHCLVNDATVLGTGLAHICEVASTPEEFRRSVTRLYEADFTEAELEQRQRELNYIFDNEKNAAQMISRIWN